MLPELHDRFVFLFPWWVGRGYLYKSFFLFFYTNEKSLYGENMMQKKRKMLWTDLDEAMAGEVLLVFFFSL